MSVPVVAAIGVAAALAAGAAATVRALTPLRRWDPFDALLLVLALVAAGEAASAAGMLAWPPPLAHAVLAASSLAVLLVGAETAAQLAAPVAVRPLRAVAGGVLVALVALCLWGGPDGPVPDVAWRSSSAMALFWVTYGAAHVAVAGYVLVVVVRLLLRLRRGPLRQATALVTGAVLIGVLFGVSAALLAGNALWWDGEVGLVGFEIGSLSYLLVAAAGIRVQLARAAHRTADRRLLRTLTPLLHELRGVAPGPSLNLPTCEWVRPQSLGITCVRADVEIRDSMALVAHRLPTAAWQEAVAAATIDPDPESAAAAGWIRAALASSHTYVAHSPVPPEADDIDDDLLRLARIADVPARVADRIAGAITAPTGRERVR